MAVLSRSNNAAPMEVEFDKACSLWKFRLHEEKKEWCSKTVFSTDSQK